MRSIPFGAVRSTQIGKHAAFFVPIGAEPPIDVRGGRAAPDANRRVSLRWLIGTGLTGLIGAGLLGGAIYAAFDREANFAEAPTRAILARKEPPEGVRVNPSKGDRIVKPVNVIAAKHTFKAAVAVRVGDKEVLRTHTFTRVATTLTLADMGLSSDIPRFNPLKLLADARNPAPDLEEPAPAPDTEEVTFTSANLSPTEFEGQKTALSLEEVRAQVAETVKNDESSGAKAPLPLPPQLLLMRTSRAALDAAGPNDALATPGVSNSPFSSIEVHMVPENVTVVPRTAPPPVDGAHASGAGERLVVVGHGQGIRDVLVAAGVSRDVAAAVKDAFHGDDPAKEGRRVKLTFSESENGKGSVLARVSVYDGEELKAAAALADDGRFVQVESRATAENKGKRRIAEESDESDDAGAMRLYNSFYETALKQDIPRPIIDQMVRIFGNDVDFLRAVRAGDSIDAFYDDGDKANGRHAELLFASITTRGETYKYYRFESPKDGGVDYFNPEGQSSRRFLLRKPVAEGRMSSPFGMRYHPILHYWRMHTGVDWAAPIGTPIFAAGNGVVIKAGWTSGYGRRVEIKHINGYETTYNHMSAFGRGITKGVHVRQGQVVGYIGMSGLATGPHLHYEVIVNGHFVNPLRVKIGRQHVLEGKALAAFKRDRDRIRALMAKAPIATQVAVE